MATLREKYVDILPTKFQWQFTITN